MEIKDIDFSKFSPHDRPIAVKLLQTYGQSCIGKWVVLSKGKDGVIEEAKISYAPGYFPKMKDEKIINVACNYAHISRRTYISPILAIIFTISFYMYFNRNKKYFKCKI
ncbi:MAG: hypothetical protein IJI84_00030 [Clostridia bacterium]|nr:hypothetical protein [Clostridia bacterium]